MSRNRNPEARLGRFVLLASAYVPVLLVAGLRGWPHLAAILAVVSAAIGLLAWALVLERLPRAQPRDAKVSAVEPVDAEVTGYVVSLLLPTVASSSPTTAEWIAYGFCAALILIVAYASNLWAVNPIVYLFGMRAVRCVIENERRIVLVKELPGEGETVHVTTRAGVLFAKRRGSA